MSITIPSFKERFADSTHREWSSPTLRSGILSRKRCQGSSLAQGIRCLQDGIQEKLLGNYHWWVGGKCSSHPKFLSFSSYALLHCYPCNTIYHYSSILWDFTQFQCSTFILFPNHYPRKSPGPTDIRSRKLPRQYTQTRLSLKNVPPWVFFELNPNWIHY